MYPATVRNNMARSINEGGSLMEQYISSDSWRTELKGRNCNEIAHTVDYLTVSTFT